MTDGSRFANQDPQYLRDVQYRDSSKLVARARLHARYGTAAERWFPWLVRQIDWPVAARVLEVGCGNGALWVECGERVPAGAELTLTDLSLGMLDEARRRVERPHVVALVDAQRLPFAPQTFDVAIANHMLYHVPSPASAVAELARVLRPSGVLLASTNGRRHLRELHAIRRHVFGAAGGHEIIDVFGREVAEPILRASFTDVRWIPYPDELRCTDATDVLAFLRSTPPVEDAPPEQWDAVVAEVSAAFSVGGGTMRVTKDTGLFVCREP